MLAPVLLLASPGIARGEEKQEKEKDKKPPLAKLVKLNERALYGGSAAVKGDRVEVHFRKPEEFTAAFAGEGLETPADLKGVERTLAKKGGKDDIPHVVAVGRNGGAWESIFPLRGDTHVELKLSMPVIRRGGQFNVLIKSGDRTFVGTSFFNTAVYVNDGQTRMREATQNRKFAGPAEKWYNRTRAELPVRVSFAKGTFSVKLDKDEIVKLDGVTGFDPNALSIQFRNVSFVISDVHVSTGFDREWCQAQLDRLEQQGELRTKDEAEIAQEKKEDPEVRKRRLREQEAEVEL